MRAVHLQTEHLTEPMGLGIAIPRFYWHCEGGMMQTAYRIVAGRGQETVWDSGKVHSASMTHIPYGGKPLESRDRINWTVTLWDEKDVPGEAAESRFEMGLLKPSDWTAKWISGDYKPNKKERYPVDCFRKVFSIKRPAADDAPGETMRTLTEAAAVPVKKARLYVSARGVYDVTLNGKRMEDFILAPGMTDYRRRIQYQTYDVTALLQEENTM